MMAVAIARSSGTGAVAGEVKDYAAVPRGAQTHSLSIQVDYLRTKSQMVVGEVQGLHGEVRELDLIHRTLAKSKNDVSSLLDELAYQRGMAWTDIAEVAGVSVSAVRKWRKGGDASPDNRGRLAKFAALLDALGERGLIEDPANWMEMDLPLSPGYYVRPLDLYLKGQVVALLDIAERRRAVEHVLDDIQPGWRDNRSKFEVFEDIDGLRSLRARSE